MVSQLEGGRTVIHKNPGVSDSLVLALTTASYHAIESAQEERYCADSTDTHPAPKYYH